MMGRHMTLALNWLRYYAADLWQEGMLNTNMKQTQGTAWVAASVAATRIWDRDGEPNAYHAAQLITVDLATGEHQFHRPHSLCGLTDLFMKFHPTRMAQFRKPDRSAQRGAIEAGWASTKWAGREWRPLVSFRMEVPSPKGAHACDGPSLFTPGRHSSFTAAALYGCRPPPPDCMTVPPEH